MEIPPHPEPAKPAIRRWADWLDRQWGALSELGRTAVVLGALAAAALVGLAAWTDWVKDVKETPLLVSAAMPDKEKSNEVAAAAWLDPRGDGREVRLWVLFRNDSAADVQDLHYLKLDTPGFRWVACMAGGGPDCLPQGHGRHPVEGLPTVLHPGESRAVFGRLEPTGRASHGVSGAFGWRDRAGEHAGFLVVPEGPADRGWQRALDFVGRLVLFVRDLVKDLAWPVVLALLGWYLKRRDDRREKAEQDAEREREAKETAEKEAQEAKERRQREEREERERRQAGFQQTWNLMLPKSHRNAERHYMPVLNRVDELCRSASGSSPDATRRLWALLTLFRAMRDLSLSIGGFYFRDLEAEELAGRCWQLFFLRAEEGLGRRDLEFAIDQLSSSETLDTFSRRLERPQAAAEGPLDADDVREQETVKALKALGAADWMSQDLGQALPLVQAMSCIVLYEMNRTYELWYRTPAKFDDRGFNQAVELLRGQQPARHDLESLVNRLALYPATVREHREKVKKALAEEADGF